jgi:hypothetical protein
VMPWAVAVPRPKPVMLAIMAVEGGAWGRVGEGVR